MLQNFKDGFKDWFDPNSEENKNYFNVQISNKFATMISIGAQSNGNIIGEDATSLSRMYKGSIDRTYKEKLDKQTSETEMTSSSSGSSAEESILKQIRKK